MKLPVILKSGSNGMLMTTTICLATGFGIVLFIDEQGFRQEELFYNVPYCYKQRYVN
jgi:hypothetical protein